ncbi:MAG TPA: UxaA family hydrolase, partial [Verrucomicrobiae bacterium]|nr:UxaA family hydrolase [Verrucomicrobiae bacterium]
MTTSTRSTPIADIAVVVNQLDNVAVVKQAVPAGLLVELLDGSTLELKSEIAPGNRFALRDIPEGEHVLQYGQPIGTSHEIKRGEAVTRSNMTNEVPTVREVPEGLATPTPDYIPVAQRKIFMGFRRADGRVGTRNFLLIVPTSMCASHEAMQISTLAEFMTYSRERFPNVDGVSAIPHNKGCGCQDGSPVELLLRVLSNYADHPNV